MKTRTDDCGCAFKEIGGSATEWPHWVQTYWCNRHRMTDPWDYEYLGAPVPLGPPLVRPTGRCPALFEVQHQYQETPWMSSR